jgi:hypothetical protein
MRCALCVAGKSAAYKSDFPAPLHACASYLNESALPHYANASSGSASGASDTESADRAGEENTI